MVFNMVEEMLHRRDTDGQTLAKISCFQLCIDREQNTCHSSHWIYSSLRTTNSYIYKYYNVWNIIYFRVLDNNALTYIQPFAFSGSSIAKLWVLFEKKKEEMMELQLIPMICPLRCQIRTASVLLSFWPTNAQEKLRINIKRPNNRDTTSIKTFAIRL